MKKEELPCKLWVILNRMSDFEDYTGQELETIFDITDEFEFWSPNHVGEVCDLLDNLESNNEDNENQSNRNHKRRMTDESCVDDDNIEVHSDTFSDIDLFSDSDPLEICQVGGGASGGQQLNLIKLKSIERRFSRKFNVASEVLQLEIVNSDTSLQPNWLDQMITEILNTIRTNFNIQRQERVRLTINHPTLDTPIYISFRPFEQLTLELILNEILKIMQSNKTFILDNETTISVVYIPTKSGGVFPSRVVLNQAFMKAKKYTFLSPVPNPGYQTCFGQSIILGMTEIFHQKTPQTPEQIKYYNQVKTNPQRQPLQINLTMKLYEDTGVDPTLPTGRTEWCKFQDHLKDRYQIVMMPRQLTVLYTEEMLFLGFLF
ncbi:hypothetical protein SNE40_021177 [Patella caerulea]|uniref:Uncharacterized protein n=1 Tax=Patella caerulea TaxID=87958 RepID=A0AAN8G3T8_PATCE